ncbi:hypothetical protein ACFL3B_04520 [Gemmatimonadota bacterium]
MTVSLDGLATDHGWLRGRSGSFERARRTIKRLASESHLKAMDVITCVNQRNLYRLDELRDLLKDLGVPAWRLFIISPIGRRATREPELFLEPGQFHELLRKILRWRDQEGIEVALSESGYLGRCQSCAEWGQCRGNALHLWDREKNQTRMCHFHDFDLRAFDGKLPSSPTGNL